MPAKTEHIFNKIKKIQYLMNIGRHHDALNLLNELQERYPNNPTVQFNKVGLLIDCGNDLRNPSMVEDGIKLGEKLIVQDESKKYLADLYYNLANGYSYLYTLYWNSSKELEQTLDNKYLQKAKRYYRDALVEEDNLSLKLRKTLLTNYANCLLDLGRNLEALYCYDEVLKIEPTFGMALGNYATAILNFASISGAYRNEICIDAYNKLKSVLNDPSLTQYGGIKAREHFKKKYEAVENWLNDNGISSRKLSHKKYSDKGLTDFEKFYLDICSQHKLFLNFHIQDNTCHASVEDPICIRMTTPVEDDHTFYELSKYVNQIKEDFVTARLLFAQSQYEREDFNRISKRTDYVYALDYSMFNLYCGLLKSAFTLTHNILDKIALFINDFYSLRMDAKKVSFKNIWKVRGASGDRIVDSKNFALYALYDIYLDFESGYYKRIQDIRNAITHRRLIIFDSTCISEWDEKVHGCNIGYKTMVGETINLLELVKSAVIYLVNAVELEERKKRRESKGPVVPIYASTLQLLPPFGSYQKYRKYL